MRGSFHLRGGEPQGMQLSVQIGLPSGVSSSLACWDFCLNANALTSPFCKSVALLSQDCVTGRGAGSYIREKCI